MSQELAEGVWASTYSGRAATQEGPFHAFDLYGDAVESPLWHKPLHEATDTIYEITHDFARFDEGVMKNIREYVKNLNRITVREDDGYGNPVECFEPSSVAQTYISRAYAAQSGESITLLGTPIQGDSFAIFANYVMTNTSLWPEDWEAKGEDPRVAMIDKFRSQSAVTEGRAAA